MSLRILLAGIDERHAPDLVRDVVPVRQLAAIPNVVGIKDATGDLARPTATARAAGVGFLQLSGHDATAAFNLAGGRGCISVVSNVAPRLCADLQRACREGDFRAAAAIQTRLAPLISALERETKPGPIKLALSLLRPDVSPDLRLATVARAPGTATAVADALEAVLGWMPGNAGREPEPTSRAA